MTTPNARLLKLEPELLRCVRGQPDALARLAKAVIRMETGAAPLHGPPGCYLFAGPTGVGKTMTALTLAQVLFGKPKLLRIDCSEYKTLDSFTTLLGDRQGDRGRLGRAYDQNPEGVWLWDEIEKGHPELVQLFLQMGDAARLTLTCGDTLDLSRIYLVATTNLGSAEILDCENLTFTSLESHVVKVIEQSFRPELLARFGHPFVFAPLGREVQVEIVDQRLEDLLRWHAERGRRLEVDPPVRRFLIYRGFSRRLGARPLVAFIEESVGDAVAADLVVGGAGSGLLVVEGNQLKLVP
jgi:ATP-dependent Clp protease ATP-binding subunit ClpA